MTLGSLAQMPTDLDIARAAALRPAADLADDLGLTTAEWEPFGWHCATVDPTARAAAAPGHATYVVVTAISPTPLGEGKTTTAIGLAQALHADGGKGLLTLRQPSLGPTFGLKGGATGGGRSQVVPMERINLHLTGAIHAVTSAHNMLAALVDNKLHHGDLMLDPRDVTWRRALDINDRALRDIVIGLGGRAHGVTRQTGFDITAASEVMTTLGLAASVPDLRERLGRLVVAWDRAGRPVTADDIDAAGAMAAILIDAVRPSLVQTLNGSPVLIHGGPFGNIANGASSVIADAIATRSADMVITEAGFGADLGFERFCNVKCRVSGLQPDVAVIVTTVRALKAHSGRYAVRAGAPLPGGILDCDPDAVRAGGANLSAHIDIVRAHGVTPVVAINRFPTDHDEEIAVIADLAAEAGARCAVTTHVANGAEGAAELLAEVRAAAAAPSQFRFLYDLAETAESKIGTIATQCYGADGIDLSPRAHADLARIENAGYGGLPIIVAKTHASLSHDPTALGRPRGWRLPVREIRLAAGAGYLTAICGSIQLMPGLPRHPAAEHIDIDQAGLIVGLA